MVKEPARNSLTLISRNFNTKITGGRLLSCPFFISGIMKNYGFIRVAATSMATKAAHPEFNAKEPMAALI